MAFGVFMHRPDSVYDDVPAERYQFPRAYLTRVQRTVGDWIVYLEPSKVRNTRGYFAVAQVQEIIPDPRLQDMFIAVIRPGSYLDFGDPVPFRGESGIIERGILNEAGKISGRAQAAVRPLSPEDFVRIVAHGLGRDDDVLPRVDAAPDASELNAPQAPFEYPPDRERVLQIMNRAVRDRNFRQAVLRAYAKRCAITGLKLINGGGRAEVEAAHIKPVEANGPDIVSNGVALCGTAHWMFDRGLVGINDDFTILVSRQSNDPSAVRAMINPTGKLLLPQRRSDHPRAEFMAWHRERCFKM